jgi:hypothetical protein
MACIQVIMPRSSPPVAVPWLSDCVCIAQSGQLTAQVWRASGAAGYARPGSGNRADRAQATRAPGAPKRPAPGRRTSSACGPFCPRPAV